MRHVSAHTGPRLAARSEHEVATAAHTKVDKEATSHSIFWEVLG
jgi:hypothetical protein